MASPTACPFATTACRASARVASSSATRATPWPSRRGWRAAAACSASRAGRARARRRGGGLGSASAVSLLFWFGSGFFVAPAALALAALAHRRVRRRTPCTRRSPRGRCWAAFSVARCRARRAATPSAPSCCRCCAAGAGRRRRRRRRRPALRRTCRCWRFGPRSCSARRGAAPVVGLGGRDGGGGTR